MPIYEFAQTSIIPLKPATFGSVNLREREDIQRLLRDNVEVISPDTLVISEEFGEWEDSKRRIDLLGIDRDANLIVIELKRTDDGGHMELQAIRYASMISTMTFDQAANVYAQYLAGTGKSEQDARASLLEFLDWDEPDEDQFAQDVRIILASAEFSLEITSAVMWLNEHGVDIRCVRLKPYSFDSRVLVDVQQIIPLPEAAEFQVRIREKVQKSREARASVAKTERYDLRIDDQLFTSLPKRRAIYLICRRLCEDSIPPEEIAALMPWRKSRVFFAVDGEVTAKEFLRLAEQKAREGGGSFSARRWFWEDDELLHVRGKTYAFSDQWGGEKWHKAMAMLKERFVQLRIDYSPSE